MTKLKRRSAIALAAGLGLWSAGDAWGGYKFDFPVTVSVQDGNLWGQGLVGSAADSADSIQNIGCLTVNSNAEAQRFAPNEANCGATDVSGTTVSCRSSDPTIIELAGAINGDSYIYFSTTKNGGECNVLYIANYSYTPPKQP